LTISGTAGLLGGVGLDVSYQLSDRLALAGQASSLFLVHNDVSAQVRFFPVASERAGLYLAGGVHGILSPVLFLGPAPGASLAIGGEFRAHSGFTIGGEVGAIGLYAPSEGSHSTWGPVVMANVQVRAGYSFWTGPIHIADFGIDVAGKRLLLLALIRPIIDALGIPRIVDRLCPMERPNGITHGQVIEARM
jgi:hypothetical protein